MYNSDITVTSILSALKTRRGIWHFYCLFTSLLIFNTCQYCIFFPKCTKLITLFPFSIAVTKEQGHAIFVDLKMLCKYDNGAKMDSNLYSPIDTIRIDWQTNWPRIIDRYMDIEKERQHRQINIRGRDGSIYLSISISFINFNKFLQVQINLFNSICLSVRPTYSVFWAPIANWNNF